jgi:hypothetical protein
MKPTKCLLFFKEKLPFIQTNKILFLPNKTKELAIKPWTAWNLDTQQLLQLKKLYFWF